MHRNPHPDRFILIRRKSSKKLWCQFSFHRNRKPDSGVGIIDKGFENFNGNSLIMRYPHPRVGVTLDDFEPYSKRGTLASGPAIILWIITVAQSDELISRKNCHRTPFKFDQGMKKPVEPFHLPSM